MDPRHLMQLAVIVELGSLTKAARKLNVTQPTLSQSIKLMEDRVGGAVLRRWRYGVTATDIGARLADEGREIIRRSERASQSVQEWRAGLSGEIRVGVGPMLAATIMGDLFADCLIKPPDYGLKIVCEYAARLVDRLNNDQLDVAIIPYELNSSDDGLVRKLLFQDYLSVFIGSHNPLNADSVINPEQLSTQHWISIGETAGLFDGTRDTLKLLGLNDVIPKIEDTGDVNMIFRMLERTNACSVLPFRQLSVCQSAYSVVPVKLEQKLPDRHIGLWTTFAALDRPDVIDFQDRLKTHLQKLGLTPD